MSDKKIAEHNNAPVDVEQVLKDMFDQVTEEVKEGIDNNSVDVATILDNKVNERIDAVFKKHWNETLRKWVEARITEEVADQAVLLGKRIGELMGKRGEL